MKKLLFSMIALLVLVVQAVPVQATPQALAGTLTALSGSPQPAGASDKITLTATVFIPPASVAAPTGSVQFQIDGANYSSPVPLSGRHAVLTLDSMTQGNHPITAAYSGDDHYAGSTSMWDNECVDLCDTRYPNALHSAFLLSNERPGHLIHRLVNAGYGDKTILEALSALKSLTGADQYVTQDFLNVLALAPSGAQINTLHLNQIDYDGAFAMSTDGSVRPIDLTGQAYFSKTGSQSDIFVNSSLGYTRFIKADSLDAPLTIWYLTESYGGGVINLSSKFSLIGIAFQDLYPYSIYVPLSYKG